MADHKERRASARALVLGTPATTRALDRMWRESSANLWACALFEPAALLGDYADFLGPHVRLAAVTPASWQAFWLDEVDAARLPRNRAQGMAPFFQARQKSSAGTAFDARHMAEITAVDAIVTADTAFAAALLEMAPMFARAAQVIEIEEKRIPDSLLRALPAP